MFAGDYLNMGSNIGHEFINLYKTDDGNHYAYVQPWGSIDKEIDYIVNVIKKSEPNVVQIMSYSKVKSQQNDCFNIIRPKRRQRTFTSEKNQNKVIHEKQIKYIEQNNVTYGGLRLNKYFERNHEENNHVEKNKYQFYLSFETEEISIPKFNKLLNFTMPQSSKRYITLENGKIYHDIIKNINNGDLWYPAPKLNKSKLESINKNRIFYAINKDYDENIISNLLTFLLNNEPVFLNYFLYDFLKLHEDEKIIEPVLREYKHIDILLKTNKRFIVIENKIKASINLYDNSNYEYQNQLEKYKYIIKNEVENINDSYKNGSKYIVLSANHNNIDMELITKSGYEFKWYSDLSKTLKNIDVKKIFFKYHFSEMLEVVEIHKEEIDNRNKKIQESRLLDIINSKNITNIDI